MSVFSAIKGFFAGDGVGTQLVKWADKRWPAKMSEAERAELEQKANELDRAHEVRLLEIGAEQDAQFNERTIALEGTAQDLRAVPVIGPVIILLRGAFRPLFSYYVGYLDYLWLTTDTSDWAEQKNVAMLVINILVIGFYFGERALKNLLPMFLEWYSARSRAAPS